MILTNTFKFESAYVVQRTRSFLKIRTYKRGPVEYDVQ